MDRSCTPRRYGTVGPAAGTSLCRNGGAETHRGGLDAQPHARGSATRMTSECPQGARTVLNDYSGTEAVRSRG